MNEAKINAKADKIFDAWDLDSHGIDDDVIYDIKSAIREAYIKGYDKGFNKCAKEINKARERIN